MLTSCEYAYTQARLQARHGLRLNEQQWQRLESQQGLSGFLHLASESSLADWLAGVHDDNDVHRLESRLLTGYKSYIDELARWLPDQWQAATRWCAIIVDLPLVEHLRQQNPSPHWLADDHELKSLFNLPREQQLQKLSTTSYAPLSLAWHAGIGLLESWQSHWHECWPQASKKIIGGVKQVEELLVTHYQTLSDPTLSPAAANDARKALAYQLTLIFRRKSQQPAAIFAHLGLVALDLERLRGNLSMRALLLNTTESVEK